MVEKAFKFIKKEKNKYLSFFVIFVHIQIFQCQIKIGEVFCKGLKNISKVVI